MHPLRVDLGRFCPSHGPSAQSLANIAIAPAILLGEEAPREGLVEEVPPSMGIYRSGIPERPEGNCCGYKGNAFRGVKRKGGLLEKRLQVALTILVLVEP